MDPLGVDPAASRHHLVHRAAGVAAGLDRSSVEAPLRSLVVLAVRHQVPTTEIAVTLLHLVDPDPGPAPAALGPCHYRGVAPVAGGVELFPKLGQRDSDGASLVIAGRATTRSSTRRRVTGSDRSPAGGDRFSR